MGYAAALLMLFGIAAALVLLVALGLRALAFVRYGRLSRWWTQGLRALQEGKYAQAEEWLRRSLARSERVHSRPVNRWRTSFHLAALGTAVAAQGRLEEAETLLARALGAPPRPDWATADFAFVYRHASFVAAWRGDPKRQLELLDSARTYARYGGAPAVVPIDVERASLLRRLGNPGAAERVLESEHMPRPVLAKFGRERLREGDAKGAVALLERAVSLERDQGRASSNLAFFYCLLADGYERMGRPEQTRQMLAGAIETYEALSAPALVVAPLLVKLARVQTASGDDVAAAAACRRALAIASPKAAPQRSCVPYREVSADDPLSAAREEAEQLLAGLRKVAENRGQAGLSLR
jgi:tetratricopeptide (TPR) repeat protein